MPFLDRRMERRLLHAARRDGRFLLTVIAMGVLTYKGATAKEAAAAGEETVNKWMDGATTSPRTCGRAQSSSPRSGCLNCHTYGGEGASNLGAPDLTDIGAQAGKDVAVLRALRRRSRASSATT